MELTFVTDLGGTFTVEIDPNMELENVMALLEAESGIPVSEQSLSYEGRDLSNPKETMAQCGVGEKSVLLLRRKVHVPGTSRAVEQDTEMMRLQILGDPQLMAQLRQTAPEILDAAQNNPARFAELIRQTRQRHMEAQVEADRERMLLEADPFSLDAQRKIEDAIQQQAVLDNLEHALEYSPEFFGRVTMLYIPVEVNGHPVKAFVDSGAQSTISTIMRLLDRRFSGIAQGVGTARILGRVHSAQLKLADLHLPCSFTIMEGRAVDLLFGLDMLKAHQACIDLEKNVLRIQGREVSFLAEHELPDKARDPEAQAEAEAAAAAAASASGSGAPSGSGGLSSFPGAGHTLGAAPAPAPMAAGAGSRGGPLGTQAAAPQQAQSRYPEDKVSMLVGLGATREHAIALLDAAGGNVDVAASLLFQ
ncbi:snare binding protein [Ganoderma leucocontextum]|nr:snare binding protein [Ganoderma leucocontextum]